MESHRRSIAKAISYRIFGSLTTVLIAWVAIGRVDLALQVGLADVILKSLVYFLHERLWNYIAYGRPVPVKDDFQI